MSATIWFAGTPQFAAYSLQQLLAAPDYHVAGVLTQPDRPAGRGQKLTASAVKTLAVAHNIPVAQPVKLSADAPPFADLPRPDLIIVAAYGLLLPPWFLAYPRYGCLNIHASLLPRWRGSAPIQRAILAGDHETGIAIMQMDAGLDTGAVWQEARLTIDPHENAGQLHDRLMILGANTLLATLPHVLAGNAKPTPQAATGATYAAKLSKAEGKIAWHDPATTIARQIRAFNPFPAAFTTLDGQNVRLWQAEAQPSANPNAPAGTIIDHTPDGVFVATGAGILALSTLQLAGKKPVSAAQLRNGRDWRGKCFA